LRKASAAEGQAAAAAAKPSDPMGQGADPNQETLAPRRSPPTPQPPRVHYLLDLFSRESEPTRHGGEREKARRARKGDERERDVEFGGGPGCQASSLL